MSYLQCAACTALYQDEMDEAQPDGCPYGETHDWERTSAAGTTDVERGEL